jgi:hypothetical protein
MAHEGSFTLARLPDVDRGAATLDGALLPASRKSIVSKAEPAP